MYIPHTLVHLPVLWREDHATLVAMDQPHMAAATLHDFLTCLSLPPELYIDPALAYLRS